jgi:hypothetical protein
MLEVSLISTRGNLIGEGMLSLPTRQGHFDLKLNVFKLKAQGSSESISEIVGMVNVSLEVISASLVSNRVSN